MVIGWKHAYLHIMRCWVFSETGWASRSGALRSVQILERISGKAFFQVAKWPSSITVAVRGTGGAMKGKPPWLHGPGHPPQENQKAGSMFGIGHYSFKMHPVHSDEIVSFNSLIEFSARHHQHLLSVSLQTSLI